jgi:hypothetical protein
LSEVPIIVAGDEFPELLRNPEILSAFPRLTADKPEPKQE